MQGYIKKSYREYTEFRRIGYNRLLSQGVVLFLITRKIANESKRVNEYYRCKGESYDQVTKTIIQCPFSAKLTYSLGELPRKLEVIRFHSLHSPVIMSEINKEDNIKHKIIKKHLQLNQQQDDYYANENDNNIINNAENRRMNSEYSDISDISDINDVNDYNKNQKEPEYNDKKYEYINLQDKEEKTIDTNLNVISKNNLSVNYESAFTIFQYKSKTKMLNRKRNRSVISHRNQYFMN